MRKSKIHPVKCSAVSGTISPKAKLFNRVKKQRKDRTVPKSINRRWGLAKRMEYRKIK